MYLLKVNYHDPKEGYRRTEYFEFESLKAALDCWTKWKGRAAAVDFYVRTEIRW